MIKKELIVKDLAKLLDLDICELSADFPIRKSENWDSLTILSLVGAINFHYNIAISAEEIEKCHVMKDFLELLDKNKMQNKHVDLIS